MLKRKMSLNVVLVAIVFAAIGAGLLISSFADDITAVSRDFSSPAEAADFQVVSGGSWVVSGGTYNLTNPASSNYKDNNGNISVYKDSINGDFNLSADASVTPTAAIWNDFSIIFNYQSADNYYFVSFNETSDPYTNGVFRIINGQQTRIAAFADNITAGITYAVNIVRTGSNYSVYRNGVKLAAFNDENTAGGQIGFGTRNDSATFDNLHINIPDKVAPSIPSGLKASATTSNSITLNWNASSDNLATSGYRVYRNGAYVGSSVTTAFTDNGLNPSTAYRYTITAYDSNGNVSGDSAALEVQTIATTAATTNPSKVDPSLLYYSNFETGNLSQWQTNQSCPSGVTVVTDQVRAGKYSAKFTVDDSDLTSKCPAVPNTGNPRAQLVSKPLFKNGDNIYASTSLYLPAGFPTNVPSNAFQFLELYGAPFGGGPTIGLYISGNRLQLQIAYQGNNGALVYYRPWTSQVNNPIGKSWQDLTLHVKFSPDKNVGYIELWHNNTKQTLTDTNGVKTQTMHMATLVQGVNWNSPNGTNSFYLNSYRKKGNIPGTVSIYQDEAKVGPTYQSVQP